MQQTPLTGIPGGVHQSYAMSQTESVLANPATTTYDHLYDTAYFVCTRHSTVMVGNHEHVTQYIHLPITTPLHHLPSQHPYTTLPQNIPTPSSFTNPTSPPSSTTFLHHPPTPHPYTTSLTIFITISSSINR